MKKVFFAACVLAVLAAAPTLWAQSVPSGSGGTPWAASSGAIATGSGAGEWICPKTAYAIEGESGVKIGTSQEYRISGLPAGTTGSGITFTVERAGSVLDTASGKDRYLRLFSAPGTVTIRATVRDPNGCVSTTEKSVRIYRTLVAYLGGRDPAADADLDALLEKREVLVKRVAVSDQGTILDVSGGGSDSLYQAWNSIENADVILVNVSDPVSVVSALEKIRRGSSGETPPSFAQKRIYVVSSVGTNLLGKLLAASMNRLGIETVGILRPDSVADFLLQIGGDAWEKTPFRGAHTISYQEKGGFFSLGGIVDTLAYQGFPVSFLGLLFGIAVAVLLLNFLKQVVGLAVFGIYNPVLLAISLIIADPRISLVFLAIAFLSVLCANFVARKLFSLHTAKRAFLVSVGIIFSIAFLGTAYLAGFGAQINAAFSNAFVIFPVFFMIVIADKVFHEDIDVFTREGGSMFLQFGAVSALSFAILDSVSVRYFLLSYPDLIILVVAANLVIGRYTGLQFFEYFRFWPMIRKLREEE